MGSSADEATMVMLLGEQEGEGKGEKVRVKKKVEGGEVSLYVVVLGIVGLAPTHNVFQLEAQDKTRVHLIRSGRRQRLTHPHKRRTQTSTTDRPTDRPTATIAAAAPLRRYPLPSEQPSI